MWAIMELDKGSFLSINDSTALQNFGNDHIAIPFSGIGGEAGSIVEWNTSMMVPANPHSDKPYSLKKGEYYFH